MDGPPPARHPHLSATCRMYLIQLKGMPWQCNRQHRTKCRCAKWTKQEQLLGLATHLAQADEQVKDMRIIVDNSASLDISTELRLALRIKRLIEVRLALIKAILPQNHSPGRNVSSDQIARHLCHIFNKSAMGSLGIAGRSAGQLLETSHFPFETTQCFVGTRGC